MNPNATMLSLEAVVLFSNNRTAHWLQTKSSEELEEHCVGQGFVHLNLRSHRERRCKIQEERAQAVQAKQLALLHLQEKSIKENQRLTNDFRGRSRMLKREGGLSDQDGCAQHTRS